MKKTTLFAIICVAFSSILLAQQEKGIIGFNNWLNTWTAFQPNKVNYGKPTQILSGDITSDTKLRKQETYLLLGDVFVTDSTTLTIEPGTVIIGDFETKGSLIISNGSKIIAKGTQTDPIIFTSDRSLKKPGDWGGIFILGDAPTNNIKTESALAFGLEPSAAKNITYGGENVESNSGIMSFVRIEFAGKRTRDYGYFNALTLAGVGHQTIIDNVMVSYCEGNSFNIVGGDVILNQLVSYRSSINDFEFNYGTQALITNSLAVKSPYVSGAEVSRALYVKDYDTREDIDLAKNQTSVRAENLTLVNITNDLAHDIKIGLVNEGIYIGANTSFSINNSVISGFKPAVILDRGITITGESLEKIRFTRTYFNNCKGNIFKKGVVNNDDLENWYGNLAFNNVYSNGPDDETFIDAHSSRNPDFRLRINGIIASND